MSVPSAASIAGFYTLSLHKEEGSLPKRGHHPMSDFWVEFSEMPIVGEPMGK